MTECNHYDKTNKRCMFIRGCRYPEDRFTCPLKTQSLEDAFKTYCPECKKPCFDCICGNDCIKCVTLINKD